jgi:predicted transposase YdaD
MHDILHDTPIYQLILQEGHDEGKQEGMIQGQRQALQEAIFAVALERFPRLVKLTEKRATNIQHPAILQHLLLKLSTVESEEEAKRYLSEIEE